MVWELHIMQTWAVRIICKQSEQCIMYLLAGIALLGINTDIFEARALMLNNGIVDIYSNSWGPSDYGDVVIGPGPVTQLALEYGAQEVID